MMDNEWVVGNQTVGPLYAEMRGQVAHTAHCRAVNAEVKGLDSDLIF